MTPFDVLNTVRNAGGKVVVDDGDLRVIAPPNTLTPEALVVLRENKAALIGILPNAEREAIQWVENLTPAEAEVVVQTARQEWEEIVVGTWEEAEEPVSCSTCGGLMAWWDFADRRHCMICEPRDRSLKLIADAARLRRKAKTKTSGLSGKGYGHITSMGGNAVPAIEACSFLR